MIIHERTPCRLSALAVALQGVAAALAIVAGVAPALADPAAEVTTEEKVHTVTVPPVKRAEVVGQVFVSGSLVARGEELIYPQVRSFTIGSLAVKVGQGRSR